MLSYGKSFDIQPSEHNANYRREGYKLNKLGYRGDEFSNIKELKVVTIGCSNGFGWGIKDDSKIFPNIFTQALSIHTGKSVSNWNLSMGGKSNSYIARMAILAVECLNPDICLFSFTGLGRREHIDVMENVCNYIPNNWANVPVVYKDTYKAFRILASPYDDFLNFYLNYKLIESLMGMYHVHWMFTFTDWPKLPICRKRSIGKLRRLDFADDGQHPGPRSHLRLASLFFEKYKRLSC